MAGPAWRWGFDAAVWGCWGVFAVVWAGGAVYNHRHSPAVRTRSGTRDIWLIGGVGLWLLYRFAPAHSWHRLTVGDPWIEVLGLPVLLAATAFTLWARAALGTMWSSGPLARQGHRLRTEGPYGITRHPIYTGILGMLAGTALLNGLGYWAIVVPVAIVGFEVKIHHEERLMTAAFPDDYAGYRQRVPQLFPGLGHLRRQTV
jgi:protein-S-isoprenylcysteine O-methyltransferase Ste14